MRRSDAFLLWSLMIAFSFFGFDCHRWGAGGTCGAVGVLTCHFVHAGTLHLMCNSWCLLLLMLGGRFGFGRLIVSYVIAALCALLTARHGVTAGFSGVLFAAVGMQLGMEHDINIRRVAPLVMSLALSVIFINKVAVLLHVMSCIVGFLCAEAYGSVAELRRDSRRLHGIGGSDSKH